MKVIFGSSFRTKEGLEARKAKGIKLGRKRRDDIPLETIATLRINGSSWNELCRDLNIPKSTLMRRRDEIEALIVKRTKKGVAN